MTMARLKCALLISGGLWSLNYVKTKPFSGWEAGVTTFFVVVHLSGLILANPAKACTLDCHTASGHLRLQKVCASGLSHRLVSQTCEEHVQSTDVRTDRKEQRSSWQATGGGFGSSRVAPKSCSLCTRRASFSRLDSLRADLFAGAGPRKELLSYLCAKLNISLLLGNPIFHRRGNNIFLRELPATHFPQEETTQEPSHLSCLLSWGECVAWEVFCLTRSRSPGCNAGGPVPPEHIICGHGQSSTRSWKGECTTHGQACRLLTASQVLHPQQSKGACC